jgi:hypothetical protein
MAGNSALTVLTPAEVELHDRYTAHMLIAEAAAGEAAAQQSAYWHSLWLIKRDKEWKAKGYTSEEQWLAEELLSEPWAPSRATYKGVMTAITDWMACGVDEPGVQRLLANRKVATEGDIRSWFVPGSDRELRPEVKLMLASKGETPAQALERISQLPPDQARAAAGEVVDREYVMVERDSVVVGRDAKTRQTLTYIVRHEHTRTGLLGRWRVTSYLEPLDETKVKHWTYELLSWMLSRFGLRYP